MHIKLEDVVVDPRLQSRVGLSDKTIEEYAELYDEGVKFPPVTVMAIDNQFLLIDGFHRVEALKKLGDYEVEAVVVEGSSFDDALMASWAANKAHGLTRTNADKRHVAMQILSYAPAANWSDRQIAKHIGTSHVFVWQVRQDMKKPEAEVKDTPKKEKKLETVVEAPLVDEKPEENEMIQTLVEENDRLRESIALGTMSEEDREAGKTMIEDLRAEIKLLQVELSAVKKSRDTFQAENAQLKKQIAAQQRKIKQLEKGEA